MESALTGFIGWHHSYALGRRFNA